MANYRIYINLTSNYTEEDDFFEVEVDNSVKMGEGMVDNMPVFRKEWKEITIKNKPYSYKQSPSNRYKLYDLIKGNEPTTTFYIKYVKNTTIIYGYFGLVDCKINEDKTLINLTPAIVDQYTDFIENYETAINVFGDYNLIKNGKFKLWTDNVPDFWTTGLLENVGRKFLLDQFCVSLGRELLGEDSISQSITGIKKDNSIYISFFYAFIGNPDYPRADLNFSVSLLSSEGTYRLQSDGSWLISGSLNKITYQTNALAIPAESVEGFTSYKIIPDNAPEDGIITITFYGTEISGNNVYITNVNIESSTIDYFNVNLFLTNENLVERKQYEIQSVSGQFYDIVFHANPTDSSVRSLWRYFDETTFAPNEDLLNDEDHGPWLNPGVLRVPDLMEIFATDPNSYFYKSEIVELTMYRGNRWRGGLFQPVRRHIRAVAKFAREETYTRNVDNEPVEPDGDGWVQPLNTRSFESRPGFTFWVRTPFNGTQNNWQLSEEDTSGGREYGFDWEAKQKSNRMYPVHPDSQTIPSAIDFRDICRKIYKNTHEGASEKEVYSAFFWNDSPYMEFLELQDGLNYYSMDDNFLNEIAAIHTYSLRSNFDSSSEDSALKISWKEFFEDLKVKWPSLIWFIDTDGNMHIEHSRLLGRIRSYYDITENTIQHIGDYKTYSFDADELFGIINRKEVNSGYKDFAESKMVFDKIVSNRRNKDLKDERSTRYISTDIRHALENFESLDNGILLVNYEIDDEGNRNMRYGTGQITGKEMPNGLLATSFLLKTFGKYEGTWHYGFIDDDYINFDFSKYCRIGDPIELKGIITQNYLLTDIGMALVKTKEYDCEKDITTCYPVYRHRDPYLIMDENEYIEFEEEVTDIF